MTATPNQASVATGFDPLRYLASNTDLTTAFGTDASWHYLTYGLREGRRIVIDSRQSAGDDFADNMAPTGRLTVGGTASGVIEKAFDSLLLKNAQGRTVSGTTSTDFLNHTTGQDSLRYTPKESGTDYLTVNALMGGTGTDLAGYTVSARLSQGSAMLAAGGW